MIVVAISGSIGTGKTTLCNQLSGASGWKVVHEEARGNPFLASFYDDMNRWALASQLRFMLDKTSQYAQMERSADEPILIDRTIEEDFYVFCSVLQSYNILTKSEFGLINDIFEILYKNWKRPDLVIYLRDVPENCLTRILDRGYPGDNKMELDYVRRISEKYDSWSKGYLIAPYIELNPTELDFRLPDTAERILASVRSLLRLK